MNLEKMLSPYILYRENDKVVSFARRNIYKEYFTYIIYKSSDIIALGSFDMRFAGHPRFNSIADASKSIDDNLVYNGYIFVSLKKWNRLQLLK
jgi:hypothetical protein